ncbi:MULTISPECIES: type II toxin-antitoxin system antitoxin DNA ADP-ribosyl glycohydrolase DarG [Bacillus]|uniref:type II toxin-antitoxin system antitoxin DNA ADP-ribosyl glycohydrolase DarG n=1 Tax=Bacillus TaxID=1386 RepID=UPI0021111C48|nr:macro domain-containing protein [Bacillus paranthracis]MCQ6521708.1 macro domain-containing protein [Bacillus paranthracis]MCU5228688.1 macro domain-containing protein [Bacillus paranthracis]MEC4603561.1 macro domain-containing protein [Bacillus paranthracis]
MITYLQGNLFSLYDKVDAITNTVNCVGVMGKGIALEFKKRFPENYKEYRVKCASKELTIGQSFVYEIPFHLQTKYIINFPTKKHWRHPSKVEYVEQGLDNLTTLIAEYNIKSIAMPALGCGNGNLDWKVVKPIIEEKLRHLKDVNIIVFEPSIQNKKQTKPEPKQESKLELKRPRLTKDRKKLLLLMNEYNTSTKGPLLTYLEVNMLSYLLFFENEKMQFILKSNGPFLDEIKNIILLLSTYYIEPIPNTTPNSATQIKILNTNIPSKKEILSDEHYLKVKNLIKGFETYNELLVLSVTHWFMFKENTDTQYLLQTVYNWLQQNNHIDVEKPLIQKALNRLEMVYTKTENLKLF